MAVRFSPEVLMKANKEFRSEISICQNCGKEFHARYSERGKFCSNECCGQYRHRLGYQRVLDGDPFIMRANWSGEEYKKDIIAEQGGVCAICGMPQEWNGKPLVFILDHIDGHATNNHRSNLRCICPNCDSQLDTYKSKNKNGERSYYRYRKGRV